RFLKIKDNADTTGPKKFVHTRYKQLSLHVSGMNNSDFWPQIKPDSLPNKGKGPGNQGLAGNNGGHGRNGNANNEKPMGHDPVKWIFCKRGAHALGKSRGLAKVI